MVPLSRAGWLGAALLVGIASPGAHPAIAQSSAPRMPVPTPARALLVLSKTDRTLSIVDPTTLVVVWRVPVGPDPHEVIASADGRVAYVSNYGFGAYNTITPVDLIAQQALPAIDLGPLHGPHGLAVADGKIWFTAEGAKAIGRYDPAPPAVDWVLGIGQDRTHMLVVSADGKRVITSNVSSVTVTIAEPRSGPPPPGAASGVDWTETVVPVGRGAEGIDVSPDGREAWGGGNRDATGRGARLCGVYARRQRGGDRRAVAHGGRAHRRRWTAGWPGMGRPAVRPFGTFDAEAASSPPDAVR